MSDRRMFNPQQTTPFPTNIATASHETAADVALYDVTDPAALVDTIDRAAPKLPSHAALETLVADANRTGSRLMLRAARRACLVIERYERERDGRASERVVALLRDVRAALASHGRAA